MTATDTDTTVVLDIDLDSVPCCEYRTARILCGKPATWVAALSVCGHQFLGCDGHRAKVLAMDAEAMERGGWRCPVCDSYGSYVTWRPL